MRTPRRALLALALCSVAACGGGGGSTLGKFPAWEGHGRDLFDDQVDPEAVGVQTGNVDPLLAERARQSELVGRVQIRTLSSEGAVDGDRRVSLTLALLPPPLATPKVPDTKIDLLVDPSSPSYRLVKNMDTALQGKTFVGFFYRFGTPSGEPQWRFHLAADTPAVVEAVRQAVILAELR